MSSAYSARISASKLFSHLALDRSPFLGHVPLRIHVHVDSGVGPIEKLDDLDDVRDQRAEVEMPEFVVESGRPDAALLRGDGVAEWFALSAPSRKPAA